MYDAALARVGEVTPNLTQMEERVLSQPPASAGKRSREKPGKKAIKSDRKKVRAAENSSSSTDPTLKTKQHKRERGKARDRESKDEPQAEASRDRSSPDLGWLRRHA